MEKALNRKSKIARMPLKSWIVSAIAVGLGLASSTIAIAQQPGISVQLPTVNRFSIDTVVMVPDGGTMSLGGVSRSSEGSISSGIPGVSGRPFSNRSSGISTSSSRASVTVQILSSREMSEDVLAAARASRPANYEEIQARERKADFLTRNIGRNRQR